MHIVQKSDKTIHHLIQVLAKGVYICLNIKTIFHKPYIQKVQILTF